MPPSVSVDCVSLHYSRAIIDAIAYPKVVVPSRPHVLVSNSVGKQPRTKVTREVDRETSLPAEAATNAEHEEEECEREPVAAALGDTVVGVVLESEDDEHQNCAGDEFGEELVSATDEGLGVGCEDTSRGGGRGGRGADSDTFVVVDGGDVIGVDDGSGSETAHDLSEEVHGESSPWELAEQTVGEGRGGVEVCAGVASDVHAQHETQAKTPGDGLVVAEAIAAWCASLVGGEEDLGNGAVTEEDQGEGAPEFCKRLTESEADLGPQVLVVLCLIVLVHNGSGRVES